MNARGDDFTADDARHMARALQLAEQGMFSTPPNPSVGCLMVDADGREVGAGFHARAGEPHAEVHALQAAGARARGATAYVTLEPCAHHGRTPPCVDALLAAGVTRVVAAMSDPNPRVNGGGLVRLRAAGVATAVGLLEAQATELNRGFISRMRRNLPWVTLKLAASLDGRTGLANGVSQWITGEAARADVQRLRARASAIITGAGTALADDPLLTVRDPTLPMRGRAPLRVLLDRDLRLPRTAQLFSADAPTRVFTRESALHAGATRVIDDQLTIESLPVVPASGRLDLLQLLRRLAELECNEVLIEAGSKLAGAFLAEKLVDEWVLYLAPHLLGDGAQPMVRLPLLESMADRQEFDWIDVRQIGRDLRCTLRPARGVGAGLRN
jgi:diaminohydroxyphosphoribosylaminopyrimidine deaminase/5-amino-6-(5-phosphoribosylamino)uracil reductase